MTTDEIITAIYRKKLTRDQAVGEVKATIFELENELTQTGYYHGVYEALGERYHEILGFVPLPGGEDNPHELISTKPATEESREIADKINEMANLTADIGSAKWLLRKLKTERFSDFFPTPMSPDSKTELQIRQAMLRGDMSPERALGEARATLAEIDWKFKFEIGADSISVKDWYANRMPDFPESPDLQNTEMYSQVMSAMRSNLNYVEKFEKQAMKIGLDPREIFGLIILERQLSELAQAPELARSSIRDIQAEQQENVPSDLSNTSSEPNHDIEPQFSFALREGGVIRSAGDGKYCVVKSVGKYFDFMLDHHPEVLLSLPELAVRLLKMDGTPFKDKKVLEQALYRSRERIR